MVKKIVETFLKKKYFSHLFSPFFFCTIVKPNEWILLERESVAQIMPRITFGKLYTRTERNYRHARRGKISRISQFPADDGSWKTEGIQRLRPRRWGPINGALRRRGRYRARKKQPRRGAPINSGADDPGRHFVGYYFGRRRRDAGKCMEKPGIWQIGYGEGGFSRPCSPPLSDFRSSLLYEKSSRWGKF